MKVYWDTAKEINVGQGRQLLAVPAGQAFEMDDDEALARIAQGDCSASDPKEYAAVLKRKGRAQDAQDGDAAPDQGSGAPVPPAGGSGRGRPRTRSAGADGGSQ